MSRATRAQKLVQPKVVATVVAEDECQGHPFGDAGDVHRSPPIVERKSSADRTRAEEATPGEEQLHEAEPQLCWASAHGMADPSAREVADLAVNHHMGGGQATIPSAREVSRWLAARAPPAFPARSAPEESLLGRHAEVAR